MLSEYLNAHLYKLCIITARESALISSYGRHAYRYLMIARVAPSLRPRLPPKAGGSR